MCVWLRVACKISNFIRYKHEFYNRKCMKNLHTQIKRQQLRWRQFPFIRITRISRHIRTRNWNSKPKLKLKLKLITKWKKNETKRNQTQLLGVTTIKSVFFKLCVCVCVLAIYISPFVISFFFFTLCSLHSTHMVCSV